MKSNPQPICVGSVVGSYFGRFRISSIHEYMYSGEFVDWTLGRQNVSATLSKSSIKSELYIPIFCNDCRIKDLTLDHSIGLVVSIRKNK